LSLGPQVFELSFLETTQFSKETDHQEKFSSMENSTRAKLLADKINFIHTDFAEARQLVQVNIMNHQHSFI
jgi:hypothetical protein